MLGDVMLGDVMLGEINLEKCFNGYKTNGYIN
jgi:hypothetical protein